MKSSAAPQAVTIMLMVLFIMYSSKKLARIPTLGGGSGGGFGGRCSLHT